MKKIVYIWMAIMPCLLGACSENGMIDSEPEISAITKAEKLETAEITLETAGTLAAMLGDKLATTQKLVLSGPVDADDVNTFRNKMPLLVSLDMKGVEFVESDKQYSSPWGTHSVKKETISERMFARLKLIELVLPGNIKVIESVAFTELPIETIELPQVLKKIGDSAFYKCEKLRNIVVPNNVSKIDARTFQYCNALETVVLASGLTAIGESAFGDCHSLTTIDIPETVIELGRGAFSYSGLKSIIIPDNIKVIPSSCFYACNVLEAVALSSKLVEIEDYALSHSSLKEIKIPETVTKIGIGAFSEIKDIKSIALPENLTTITSHCFSNCISLETIKLPENLLYIKEQAFRGCLSLKVIDIPQRTQLIERDVFYQTGLEALFVKGKTTLEDVFASAFKDEIPNCIIYLSFPDTKVAPELRNIVYNGETASLTLNGDNGRGSFFCHQSFKAQKITFTKAFNLDYFGAFPSSGQPAGWAAISLPFSVDKITAADGRVLAPFRAEVADAKPFWLRKLTSNGFENVTRMEAGEPYIIAMPYDERYDAEYNVRGTVTFTAQDFTNGILIPETTYRTASGPEYDFNANYEIRPRSASYYVLNTYDHVEGYKQGGVFVRSLRATYPFEPYVTNKSGVANVSKVFGIGPSVQTRAKHTVGSKPSIDDK